MFVLANSLAPSESSSVVLLFSTNGFTSCSPGSTRTTPPPFAAAASICGCRSSAAPCAAHNKPAYAMNVNDFTLYSTSLFYLTMNTSPFFFIA